MSASPSMLIFTASLLLPMSMDAQLTIVKEDTQAVFGATDRRMEILIRNTGDERADVSIKGVVLQAGSGTVARWSESPWEQVEILPRQTIAESVTFKFPGVRAETRFVIQWIQEPDKVFGTTDVWVYPTNL